MGNHIIVGLVCIVSGGDMKLSEKESKVTLVLQAGFLMGFFGFMALYTMGSIMHFGHFEPSVFTENYNWLIASVLAGFASSGFASICYVTCHDCCEKAKGKVKNEDLNDREERETVSEQCLNDVRDVLSQYEEFPKLTVVTTPKLTAVTTSNDFGSGLMNRGGNTGL